jgi:hypothetical protein
MENMKHIHTFNQFLNESFHMPDGTPIGVDYMHRPVVYRPNIDESKIGEIHIMAQESDSFTAFRKAFMDEYGKPKSVKELKELEAWLQTVWNENK